MKTAALLLTLLATRILAEPVRYFGYAGIACALDDPHDTTSRNDYIDEVAGFTNLNQVCLSPDPKVTADRLARMAKAGAISLLNVEPVLFTQSGQGLVPNPDRATLWPLVTEAIRQSGVAPGGIIFYLVDEPTLRHLPPEALSEQLVLMMDAMHTPVHQDQGISQSDMAGVARSYLKLAQDRGDVAAIIAYSWAGGIDNTGERGVRDLPGPVQDAHRKIGRLLLWR